MTWLFEIFGKGEAGETIRILDIEASRAVYHGSDVKERIELRLKIEGGHKLTLDLDSALARKLLTQVTSSYEAIHPNLRPDLRGTGNNF